MIEGKHILLCGERGVGKSTLIQRLLAENTRPVYGFYTKRLQADETGFHPIYLHPAGAAQRRYEEENLAGTCDSRIHKANLGAFNTLGAASLRAEPNGLIVMDELGFLEAEAEAFTQAVFAALRGDVPVIAAVKARFDVPFLNAVRACPKGEVYTVTTNNRDALYGQLLPFILGWNRQQAGE